ncbi:MAG: chloride channel protein, partial [Candidatus Limivicinus sp.]
MQEVLNQLHSQASRILIYSKALGKWLLVSGIAGILCGLLGSAFHLGVDLANALRLAHPWLIWLLPVAGLAIAGIY